MKTKILIVDDYNIFRKGLKLLIEGYENFEVVGEASGATDLFILLKEVVPDVIVMDIMLPQKSVISISKKLHREYPKIPFIITTVNVIEYTILECVINGASGFLWKESTPDELITAIRTVASGQRFFKIPVSNLPVADTGYNHKELIQEVKFPELSERELEVLKNFAEGLSYRQIAQKMNISPRTVESHKNNILEKLNLKSTVDLIKYAIKNHLIELF